MEIYRRFCVMISVLFLFGSVAIAVYGQSRLGSVRSKGKEFGTGGSLTLCHATGSRDNPYEAITVSDNGVAHRRHPADIIPAPEGGCPAPGPGPTGPEPVPEPVTVLLFGVGVAAAGYVGRRFRKEN